MAVQLTGIEHSAERTVNRNSKLKIGENTRSGDNFYYNPVPYDLMFEVQIASRFMVDVIQILEQILPYFQPENYINLSLPILNIDKKNPNQGTGTQPLDIKVIYEGNTPEITVDIPEADYKIILWSLNFRVQGYLFRPMFKIPLIHNINLHWFRSESDLLDHLEDFETDEVIEVEINTIINELEDGDLEALENVDYVFIKKDNREYKNIPYELSETGVDGYDRNDKDISNSLVYYNGEYWEFMGNVFDTNVKTGQKLYTKMVMPIEGDIPESIKARMEEIEELRKMEIS